jgi:hypothetical protein
MFDTLKFVETLKEAGVPEPQAKAFSTAVRESHEATDLATKGDLRELELRIDTRFEKVRTDMTDLKFELLKWMIGLAIVQVGLLITILRFLP